MAALAPPPQPLAAFVCDSFEPQSIEGRQLLEAAQAVQRHLNETVFSFLVRGEEATYHPVPFRKAFTARVRYRFVGRLKPLAYRDGE